MKRSWLQRINPWHKDLAAGQYGPVNWPTTAGFQHNITFARDPNSVTPTAWAIILGISQDISTLPLSVGIYDKEGVFNRMPSSDIQRVLDVPNPYQTGIDMLAYLLVSLLTRGNCYAYTPRDRFGNITAIHPLPPTSVRPCMVEGEVYYRVSFTGSLLEKDDALIPKRELFHVPYLLLTSLVIGSSPLEAAALPLMQQNAIARNTAALFENAAQPGGTLTSDNKISKELAERLKSEWTDKYSKGRFGQVAVLGEGLKWAPMMMTAADSQLIEQLKFNTVEISRVYRYPLVKLNALENATYRNTEAQQRDYYISCLRPLIEKLEAAMDRHWGFPYESQPRAFEFDMAAFLRSEADVRATTYKTMLDSGIVSINEVRALEGLASVAGGESPRLQMQYRPIDEEPTEPEPTPAPAPAPTDPAQEDPAPDVPAGDPAPPPDKSLRDAGVWNPERAYSTGEAVTKNDGYWVCQIDTMDEPGESPAWRLIVGRGKRGPRGADHTDEIAALMARIEQLEVANGSVSD